MSYFFLWCSYDFLTFSYCVHMVFILVLLVFFWLPEFALWISCDFRIFSYGFPMVFILFLMVFVCFFVNVSNSFHMILLISRWLLLWFSYVFLLFFHGFPNFLLWCCYGLHMCCYGFLLNFLFFLIVFI